MNEEILNELKKQTKWLRFLALPKLKEIVVITLDTNEKRRIYDLSDGQKSSPQITKVLKDQGITVSDRTIRNYWKYWFALGIVEKSVEYEKRFVRIINLADLELK